MVRLAGETRKSARALGGMLDLPAACARVEGAIAKYSGLHREFPRKPIPPAYGLRALLRARLREIPVADLGWVAARRSHRENLIRGLAGFSAVLFLLVLVWFTTRSAERNAILRADLTPGVGRLVAASDVCRARLNDNVDVVPAIQRQVFAEYGMPHRGQGLRTRLCDHTRVGRVRRYPQSVATAVFRVLVECVGKGRRGTDRKWRS